MKQVELHYNPYLLETKIIVEGIEINANNSSPFYKYRERRLQQWMEARESENWRGLLPQLRDAVNDTGIKLSFYGTKPDFEDIEQLVKADRKRSFADGIELVHANREAASKNDPAKKLEKLRDIYEEVKKGPEQFCTADVQKGFESALDDDFEIVVVAPMSSGKSTVINALLGQDLLPAINQATTAVLTRIRDEDGQKQFLVSAVDHEGKLLVKNKKATAERIGELNGKTDPENPNKSLAKEIRIQGDIPHLSSRGLHTVFVDTPGGNNNLNAEHERVMDEAIQDEDKSMVIYVFNSTQLTTKDNATILDKIARAMKRSMNGKQTRDRFLFVANRMDDVDPAKEHYEDMRAAILKELKEKEITEPNLYFVSARTAKLLRMQYAGAAMSETDNDDLDFLSKKMTRDKHALFEFSSLSEAQKEQFRQEVKMLREENPEAKRIPRVAEINSGIPALEMAINEYLERYAIAIKLQTAQNSFMSAMRDEKEKGTAWRNMAENEATFKRAQKDALELQKRLADDRTLSKTVEQMKQIVFDDKLIWKKAIESTKKLQGYTIKNKFGSKVPKDKAEKCKDEFAQYTEKLLQDAAEDIDRILQEDVQKKCDEVMQAYREQIETLRKNGLDEIGGISIPRLSTFKEVERNMQHLSNLSDYTEEVEETETRQKKKSGIGAAFARFVGGLFGTDWGWEDEEYEVKRKYVDLQKYINEQIADIGRLMQKEVKALVEAAKEEVNTMTANAIGQSKKVDDLIHQIAEEYENKTRDIEVLRKEIEENRPIYEFAEKIISEVEDLLAIE